MRQIVPIASVLINALLFVGGADAQSSSAQRLKVVVAARLMNADPVIRWGKLKASTVPIESYDFKAALADELTTQFAGATAASSEWRVSAESESVPPVLFEKRGQAIPAGLNADRLLLIDILEYGISSGWMQSPRFVVVAEFTFVDRAGKKIWSKVNRGFDGYTLKLTGELDDIQKDDQRPLKVGLNAFIEAFAADMVKDQGKKVR